ncbi:MAG: LysM peptidoglycan-binding domain-containing protein [Acidimicrobiia bacterium]
MPVNRRARAIAVGSVLALTIALFSVEYTVQRGDTLSEIARDHDVTLSEVIELNELSHPDLIMPGQVILIPGVDGNPEQTHVVVRGESLHHIASAYGTTAASIARANSLGNPDVIIPGQQLLIPATGKAPAGGGAGGGNGGNDGESEGSNNPSPASRSGNFHIVERGDTLDSIAGKYSLSPDDIAAANGITSGKVYTGTRLFLDGPSFVSGGGGGSGEYTVKQGDRLGDIAARHGTSISNLAEMNGLSDVNLIRSGQTLKVPGGSSWVCPVEGARYFNDWGFPRGGSRFHEGNDLFAGNGSPVRAPVSGTVELIKGTVGGLQFNLIGSDGVEYLGSHLSESGKTGKVGAGDVIGYVGTSGNAKGTNPHLHFGMYREGLAINPHPTLVANGC